MAASLILGLVMRPKTFGSPTSSLESAANRQAGRQSSANTDKTMRISVSGRFRGDEPADGPCLCLVTDWFRRLLTDGLRHQREMDHEDLTRGQAGSSGAKRKCTWSRPAGADFAFYVDRC